MIIWLWPCVGGGVALLTSLLCVQMTKRMKQRLAHRQKSGQHWVTVAPVTLDCSDDTESSSALEISNSPQQRTSLAKNFFKKKSSRPDLIPDSNETQQPIYVRPSWTIVFGRIDNERKLLRQNSTNHQPDYGVV
eukprot:c3635_g1_i1.p1 GENE.c3635_g1_i1~~c3635_g1_i1.p1  ORF type:complete len:134 (-),score=26.75 c3635_g1_i1:155-556(-)